MTNSNWKKFVATCKENEAETSEVTVCIKNIDILSEYFHDLFNSENFNKVFYFLNKYIDLMFKKCSSLRKIYLKGEK